MKKKPTRAFHQLSIFLIGKKDPSKDMAEKQSPQSEAPGKLTPEDAAAKIVKARKDMKRGKMPVKPNNLYDEL